ncbi:MAG: hypothetical protein N3D11_09520 [Candidatus Sumerlaeia bacterium]|nr:hypothetical protein [Candidatus Sumerlaeia bacterium]
MIARMALLAACLILPAPALWAIMRAEATTLEYQVRESDVIARGTCVDINVGWSNRHIVTTYKIAVSKYIKAPAKMSVASHPVLFVSQLGGRLEKPLPLEESYPEMVALTRNEEVVLFLQSPDRVPAPVRAKYDEMVRTGKAKPSPLMTNYRLTAMSYSKLNVLTDPKTGAQTVTRFSFDKYGLLPTSEAVQRFLDAYQAQQDYVEYKQGEQTIRIPVPVAAKPTVTVSAASIEEQMRQMQTYSAPWSAFEQQVLEILNRPAAPAAAPAAASPQAAKPQASR